LQPVIPTEGRQLPEGRPVLVDRAGRVVLSLHPLAQLQPPLQGAEEELFLFAGPGRRGARLVAEPVGFEHFDEGVWEWLRQLLDEEQRAAEPKEDLDPYPGLRSFTADEAALFLGRETETAAVVNRLRRQSLLVVAGPSGSGKSSFVHAGVVPSLPEGWRVVSLRPGRQPFEALAARLGEIGVRASAAALEETPAALGEALRGAGPVVLVVDQFEEAFTLVEAEVTSRLAAALAFAAHGDVRVVLTLRDDFLARANQLAPLTDRLSSALVLLATPAPADLLRIVVEPARRAGYDFDDPDLPGRMVAEVAGKPGALPLLAFTAASLWEQRDRHFRQLTERAYRALGGVGGALAQHADGLLAKMTAAERAKVREAFRHLVTSEGTRATLSRTELAELAGEPVVEKLIAARLLGSSEERQVEIVHEALVVSWPRLVGWRREDLEGGRLLDQLRIAARTWQERGRPRGLLWREEALAEYKLWRARSPAALTEGERAFAAASLREETRGRRWRRGLAAAVILALGATAILLYLVGRQSERLAAENRRRLLASYEDQGRQLLLAGDAQRGLAYLVEARAQGADDPTLGFLVARGIEQLAPQRRVMIDQDLLLGAFFGGGERVMTVARGGQVVIWEAGAEKRRMKGHESGVKAVAAEGDRVLTAGSDRKARLWRTDGQLLATLAHAGEVTDVGFGGERLITGSRDTTAKIWEASGDLVATLPANAPVAAVALSPDSVVAITGTETGEVALWKSGTRAATLRATGESVSRVLVAGDRIAAASGSFVEVWDLAGAAVARLEHQGRLRDLAASPDGTRLLTASQDGTGRVWDAQTGKLLAVLVGHEGWLFMARFCANDRIVTGGTDRTVRLWDAQTGQLQRTLVGHRDLVRHVACAEGKVLSAGFDRTARLWDPDLAPVRRRIDTGVTLGDFALSLDGTRLVTVGLEGKVEVRDLVKGKTLATLGRPATHPISARFTKDGRQVVLALFDEKLAELWDVDGAKLVRTFAGHTDRVGRAEVSGDDLLTASRDGTARVWSLATGQELREVSGHEGWVLAVGLSPDGKTLATGGQDQTVRLWRDAQPLHILRGHSSWIQRVLFDPTGARLLTTSSDATAKIWDVTSGDLLSSLEAHSVSCTAAAWSPSGTLVATIGDDDRAAIWDARSGQLLHLVPSHHGLRGRIAFLGEETLLTAGEADTRITEWDLHVDRRSGGELLDALRCLVPFEVRDGRLVPRGVEGC
jgi:WD40 repeat protein